MDRPLAPSEAFDALLGGDAIEMGGQAAVADVRVEEFGASVPGGERETTGQGAACGVGSAHRRSCPGHYDLGRAPARLRRRARIVQRTSVRRL
jgi:hypothetical protein